MFPGRRKPLRSVCAPMICWALAARLNQRIAGTSYASAFRTESRGGTTCSKGSVSGRASSMVFGPVSREREQARRTLAIGVATSGHRCGRTRLPRPALRRSVCSWVQMLLWMTSPCWQKGLAEVLRGRSALQVHGLIGASSVGTGCATKLFCRGRKAKTPENESLAYGCGGFVVMSRRGSVLRSRSRA